MELTRMDQSSQVFCSQRDRQVVGRGAISHYITKFSGHSFATKATRALWGAGRTSPAMVSFAPMAEVIPPGPERELNLTDGLKKTKFGTLFQKVLFFAVRIPEHDRACKLTTPRMHGTCFLVSC